MILYRSGTVTLLSWKKKWVTIAQENITHHSLGGWLPKLHLVISPCKCAISSGDTVLPPTDVTSSVWLFNKSLPACSSRSAYTGVCAGGRIPTIPSACWHQQCFVASAAGEILCCVACVLYQSYGTVCFFLGHGSWAFSLSFQSLCSGSQIWSEFRFSCVDTGHTKAVVWRV